MGRMIIVFLSFFQFNQLGAQEVPSEVNLAEESWLITIASGDKSAYRELLSDDFTWTYINGHTINKEEARILCLKKNHPSSLQGNFRS